jgi:tRNA(His) 5'-end guanylyltransferase
MWLGDDGVHLAVPADQLLPEELERLTDLWREKLRNSPLWDQVVEQFGPEKAEEILRNCRAELR